MDYSQVPEPKRLRDQVVVYLKERIASGELHGLVPSERDLAGRMDVSRLTVRAALKRLEEEGVIEVRGRRRVTLPAGTGSRLPSGRCTELVVLSSEPLEEVYHSHVLIMDMLREKLARHGFRMHVDVSPQYGMTRTGKVLAEKVRRHPDACWLLVRIPPEGQKWFAMQGLRAVVMGTPDPGLDIVSLDTDYDASCFHAASVLAARGKRSIALIRRIANLIGDEYSEAGMRRACDKANVDAVVHKLSGDSTSVIEWLKTTRAEGRMPDGIIANDPAIFLSVFSFCYNYRIRIPEEMGIICRTDDLLLDAVRPSVARYRMNDSVLLNRLWRILLPILRDQVYEKVPHFLMPDFVPGASSGTPKF